MEVIRYPEFKGRGVVKIYRRDDKYMYELKKFDPETGDPKPPETGEVDLDHLLAQKARLISEAAIIDILMKDCRAAKEYAEEAKPIIAATNRKKKGLVARLKDYFN